MSNKIEKESLDNETDEEIFSKLAYQMSSIENISSKNIHKITSIIDICYFSWHYLINEKNRSIYIDAGNNKNYYYMKPPDSYLLLEKIKEEKNIKNKTNTKNNEDRLPSLRVKELKRSKNEN